MLKDKLVVDPASTPAQVIYKLLIGSVVPRPIAFVSTVSPDGVRNLAPFSFFNVICAEPPTVCFSIGFRVPCKDTLANVKAIGEFVVNMVSEEIAEPMNLCSGDYPAGVDEFRVSGRRPSQATWSNRRTSWNLTSTWSAAWCRLWKLAHVPWAEP